MTQSMSSASLGRPRARPGLLLVAWLAAVLALAGCQVLSPKNDSAPGPTANQPQANTAGTMSAVTDKVANTVTETRRAAIDKPRPPSGQVDGIPVGFTQQGHPYRGSPDAPIIVDEYSDYHCPFCQQFATQVQPILLKEYVATGKVRFVFREFPIPSLHPKAPKAALAALCAGEQSAELYWRLHDAQFAKQGVATTAANIDQFLVDLAKSVGADDNAFRGCVTSGRQAGPLEDSIGIAKSRGFNGTPSFVFILAKTGETHELIGAEPLETFRGWFESLLAGQGPPSTPTPEPVTVPYWVSEEGLAADPKLPGVTMAGDPFQGRTDAPLTVIEFTDFQCPPCRKVAQGHEKVARAVIDTGKARWVIKNRPLLEHPQSAAAAAAAECATLQGKFWAMYDALFSDVERWSVDPPDPVLADIAGEAGLDVDAFRACLAGRDAWVAVLNDVLDAAQPAPAVPSFVIMYRGKGYVLTDTDTTDEIIKSVEGWNMDLK